MKRKITRAQLRKLLLREVDLLNEQDTFKAGFAKLSKGLKAMKDASPGPALANKLDQGDASRGSHSDIEEALQDMITSLSARIRELEKQVKELQTRTNPGEAQRLGKEAGFDPDDPGL